MNDMNPQVPDLTDPATVAQLMGDMAKGMAAMAVLGQALSQGTVPVPVAQAAPVAEEATAQAAPVVAQAAPVDEARYQAGRQVFEAMKAPRTRTGFERAMRDADHGLYSRTARVLFDRLADEAVAAFGDPTVTTILDLDRVLVDRQVFETMKTPRIKTSFERAMRDAGLGADHVVTRALFDRFANEAVAAFGDPALKTVLDLDRYQVGRHIWVDMKAPRTRNAFTQNVRDAGLGADHDVMRVLFDRLADELGN